MKRKRRKPSKSDDVALICGVSQGGDQLHLLRRRNNRVEAAVARTLREGQPIAGELVRLRPREEFPLLCDVEVELSVAERAEANEETSPAAATPARETSGPPQVSNDNYRRNWDAIWKRPSGKRLVN